MENEQEKPDLAVFKGTEGGVLLCKLQRTGILKIELPGGCTVVLSVPKVGDGYEGRVAVHVGEDVQEFSIAVGAALVSCVAASATSDLPPAGKKDVPPKQKQKPKPKKKK
jgi:hypothetical protein